jgi:hypothetical protein
VLHGIFRDVLVQDSDFINAVPDVRILEIVVRGLNQPAIQFPLGGLAVF